MGKRYLVVNPHPPYPMPQNAQPLKYLFIHCLATPEGRDVAPEDILRMHLGPADMPGGSVVYRGRSYASRSALKEALPQERVGGVSIHQLHGRGWDRTGYRLYIRLDGTTHRFVQVNQDAWVQPQEVTWGVGPAYNAVSHHVAYAGGVGTNGQPKDTRTAAQREALKQIVHYYINTMNPSILVAGHNQVANKACPSFSVPKWLKGLGVPGLNILTTDAYGHAARLPG